MVSQKDSKKVVENKLKFALRSYILYNMKGLSPLNKPWAMVFQTLLKDLSLEELEHTRTCFEIIDNKLKKGEITVAELTEIKHKMAMDLHKWKAGNQEKPKWYRDE
jgi:hypothetical protein